MQLTLTGVRTPVPSAVRIPSSTFSCPFLRASSSNLALSTSVSRLMLTWSDARLLQPRQHALQQDAVGGDGQVLQAPGSALISRQIVSRSRRTVRLAARQADLLDTARARRRPGQLDDFVR